MVEKQRKLFKAIVFDEEKQCFGVRVEIEAIDIDDAVRIMNHQYGSDKYIDLHNDDDADLTR
ncbi:MAG TPA: hypothetical protein ENJ32_05965 [Crenotrichaceae bacterium]|nr:hypothetical protein [Crenotrichaceae bacterium]